MIIKRRYCHGYDSHNGAHILNCMKNKEATQITQKGEKVEEHMGVSKTKCFLFFFYKQKKTNIDWREEKGNPVKTLLYNFCVFCQGSRYWTLFAKGTLHLKALKCKYLPQIKHKFSLKGTKYQNKKDTWKSIVNNIWNKKLTMGWIVYVTMLIMILLFEFSLEFFLSIYIHLFPSPLSISCNYKKWTTASMTFFETLSSIIENQKVT